jgi:uncharacterized protein
VIKLKGTTENYMLLHGYTGAIDIVSQDVGMFLRGGKFMSREDIPFSKETIDILIRRGYLTTKTEDEEREFVKKIAAGIHKHEMNSKKKYMFVLTYNCNFRCPYCYEKNNFRTEKNWATKVISRDYIDYAYDEMLKIEPDRNKHDKKIILYGGEPLLNENEDVVRYLINKGFDLGYHFYAITNGYDLDHYADLLSPNIISLLQVTIDGDKNWHNKRRNHYLYGDSFDKVLDNIGKALDRQTKIRVRVNLDLNNYSSLERIVKEFDDRGFLANKMFSYYSALLTDPSVDYVDADIEYLTYNNLDDISDDMIADLHLSIRSLYLKILNCLKNKKTFAMRSFFCAAQSVLHIFDPFGNMYCCWDKVGNKEYALGNYVKNEFDETQKRIWRDRNVGTVLQCSKCKYALLCGGGCLAKTITRGFDLSRSYCADFPKMFNKYATEAYETFQKECCIN